MRLLRWSYQFWYNDGCHLSTVVKAAAHHSFLEGVDLATVFFVNTGLRFSGR